MKRQYFKILKSLITIAVLFGAFVPADMVSAQNPPPHSWDDDCAEWAAGDQGISGFSAFRGNARLPVDGTGTAIYRTWVCNGVSHVIDKDITITENSSVVLETGQTNVIDFSSSGWVLSGGAWEQDMGGFAPHEWRTKEVNLLLDGTKFSSSGNYTIRVRGRARVWDASLGCFYNNFCYNTTNTLDIDLRVRVVLVPSTLSCSAAPATVQIGQPVTFTGSGGGSTGQYQWSGGETPPTGTGVNFITSFSTQGVKTVTVTKGTVSRNCNVTVAPPPPPPPLGVGAEIFRFNPLLYLAPPPMGQAAEDQLNRARLEADLPPLF